MFYVFTSPSHHFLSSVFLSVLPFLSFFLSLFIILSFLHLILSSLPPLSICPSFHSFLLSSPSHISFLTSSVCLSQPCIWRAPVLLLFIHPFICYLPHPSLPLSLPPSSASSSSERCSDILTSLRHCGSVSFSPHISSPIHNCFLTFLLSFFL